ncbi:hypothetical protein BKP37_03740 [Anaerobacillus alkalilacustris]|uniref:Uncharacterized protein n=1 Tax=Anaerobacillus alkalilacustris TaxID=393763 RepID=A0A1S2LYP9_9BACI|nr:hypothetical protein BKP37_03740 [Anaerobacillus alkalilacustris]
MNTSLKQLLPFIGNQVICKRVADKKACKFHDQMDNVYKTREQMQANDSYGEGKEILIARAL